MTTQNSSTNRTEQYDAVNVQNEQDSLRCLRAYAPAGACVGVVCRNMNSHRNLRFYVSAHNQITRIDQLVNREVFHSVLNKLGWPDAVPEVGYYGFDKTDGTKMSGFTFPLFSENPRFNFVRGLLFALAEVVHGDRDAWGIDYL